MANVPAPLRPRLSAHHAAIGAADRLLTRGIDHAETVRIGGESMLGAIQALEDDALTGADEYHAETALLNKINGASVLVSALPNARPSSWRTPWNSCSWTTRASARPRCK